MEPTTPIRVSVVVPVYNPGEHIEALIDSLSAQTLAQHDFEVIFSDDGSTDDTPGRLDRLAADRANVTVLHEPNSGWPGRPRNLGMDAARGAYVFFVDQDDWLGVEALERMTTFGDDNASDIVLGRYAGHHRGVAKTPFRKTQPAATLENTPLMDSLTPHKMFRTAFLAAHDLRFPEGRRRLEDHVFVTRAYFLAERISVLADYHCYFHVRREDAGNAGYQRIDPAGYYRNVREVVDLVLAHTEPGPLQDRCLRRPLRVELLSRLDGRSFLNADRDYQRQLFDQARRLAAEKMPLSVDAGLSPPQRIRASLLRADRLDDVCTCVEYELGSKAVARLLVMDWNDSGQLILDVEASLVERTTGQPWRYQRDGDAVFLMVPAKLAGSFPREAGECTKQLRSANLQIVLRRRADSEEWPVPTDTTIEHHENEQHVWLSYRALARVDARKLGGGRPLTSGVWDVYARITQTGWSKEIRVGSDRTPQAAAGCRPALLPGQVVVPYWTQTYDNLSLDIRADASRLAALVQSGRASVQAVAAPVDVTELVLTMPVSAPPGTEPSARVCLRLDATAQVIDVVAHPVRPTTTELTYSASVPKLSQGRWWIQFELDLSGWGSPITTDAALSVAPDGTVTVVAAPEADGEVARERPPAKRAKETLRLDLRRMMRRVLGRRLRAVLRRLSRNRHRFRR